MGERKGRGKNAELEPLEAKKGFGAIGPRRDKEKRPKEIGRRKSKFESKREGWVLLGGLTVKQA